MKITFELKQKQYAAAIPFLRGLHESFVIEKRRTAYAEYRKAGIDMDRNEMFCCTANDRLKMLEIDKRLAAEYKKEIHIPATGIRLFNVNDIDGISFEFSTEYEFYDNVPQPTSTIVKITYRTSECA